MGGNLTASQPYRLKELFFKKMGERQHGLGTVKKWMVKAGVPATNTAADAPDAVNEWCYDSTNDHFYLCTAFVSASSFTWTLII
jgi:hypothetical protein